MSEIINKNLSTKHDIDLVRKDIENLYLKTVITLGSISAILLTIGLSVLGYFLKHKDGGLRMCIDFSKLNKITETDRYPLPMIDEI